MGYLPSGTTGRSGTGWLSLGHYLAGETMTTEATKQAVDAVSVVTVIGTLADILPAVAALFTIVWTGFRIYELQTIQNWLKRKK